MDRSSRFISLSGLSGIMAGVTALVGAGLAYYRLNYGGDVSGYTILDGLVVLDINANAAFDLSILAIGILLTATFFGYFFTNRKAKKAGESVWNTSSKRMLVNMLIPLITGGAFCIIMMYHQLFGLIAPAMLLFYGLACINASHFTLTDIRYLGFCEIGLGLLNCFFLGYGLLFWTIGFGIMHIIYGTIMYLKYEK